MQFISYRSRFFSALIPLAVFASGCGGKSGVTVAPNSGSTSSIEGLNSGQSSTLAIYPTSASVVSGGTLQLSASGGAGNYTFSIVTGGGSINASSGLFTAPTVLADTTVEVGVMDSAQSWAYAFFTVQAQMNMGTITLGPASITLSSGGTQQFTASGGTGSYAYSVVSGGGTIDSTGLYTAPTVSSMTSVQISATDSNGAVGYASVVVETTSATQTSNTTCSGTYLISYGSVSGRHIGTLKINEDMTRGAFTGTLIVGDARRSLTGSCSTDGTNGIWFYHVANRGPQFSGNFWTEGSSQVILGGTVTNAGKAYTWSATTK